MSSLISSGSASGTGSMTLAAPNTNSNQTATLPDATGTVMVSGNQPTFQAFVNANQSLTGGVSTKVALSGEEWDTASAFDSTTNYRFTPQVAGYYQVNAGCPSIDTTYLGTNYLLIYKNGSVYKNSVLATSGVGGISCMVSLNGSTDYIELYINIGTSQTLSQSGNNFMSACLVRTA